MPHCTDVDTGSRTQIVVAAGWRASCCQIMKLSSWLTAAFCLAVVQGKRPDNLLNVRVGAVATANLLNGREDVVATAVATAALTVAATAAPVAPVSVAARVSDRT